MQLKLKPVYLLGKAWHVFPQPDLQLAVATDPEAIRSSVEELHRELRGRLASDVAFLEPAIVQDDSDLANLREQLGDADALLVNVSTGGLEGGLFEWEVPIIAYSGECTPMMALYNLPLAERAKHPNLTYALDAEEVDAQLRLLGVRKRLRGSKLVVLGEYLCADRLPDPELVKRKLGVEFVHVSSAEFVEEVSRVGPKAAKAVAREWQNGALEGSEPSWEELAEAAGIQLALERVLERSGAQAMSVGCLELMYARGKAPFCLVLATLRDAGRPAGCEADAGATLTMLMLDYLADRPAYMGNLVRADPQTNRVNISHGCSPARIAGRDRPAKSYRLVHSHSAPPFSRGLEGGSGVTSYVDYADVGQVVTIARLAADLEGLFAVRGEIVDCRDTICDRTTLTLQVADARSFVQHATGNHQVVVYGDHVEDLGRLCRLLDMGLIEP
jgi:L-fucose isomerase-like protein